MDIKNRPKLLHPLGWENGKPYQMPKMENIPDIGGNSKEVFPKIENGNLQRYIQPIKPFKDK